MTIAELKRVVGRRPFMPFSLPMAGGREFPVYHPNQIDWRGDDAREIGYACPGDDFDHPDHVEILDLSLILSIRWLPISAGGRRRGDHDDRRTQARRREATL
jgi:hypothetical protein